MDKFWTAKALRWGDLPTLAELIQKADEEILAREYVERLGTSEGQFDKKSARKKVRKLIKLLSKEAPGKPSKKMLLVPQRVIQKLWDEDLMSISMGSSLVVRKELESRRAALADVRPVMSLEEIMEGKRAAKNRDGKLPELYDYTLSPRREVLSYRVWLPHCLSRRERYQFLADALWTITFFGWVGETAEKRRKKEDRIIRKLAKEAAEGKAKYIPAEVFERDFGLATSTDDYASEYRNKLFELETVMSYNTRVECYRWLADLCDRLDNKGGAAEGPSGAGLL